MVEIDELKRAQNVLSKKIEHTDIARASFEGGAKAVGAILGVVGATVFGGIAWIVSTTVTHDGEIPVVQHEIVQLHATDEALESRVSNIEAVLLDIRASSGETAAAIRAVNDRLTRIETALDNRDAALHRRP